MSIEAFRHIQFKQESARGTPLAATQVAVGIATLNPIIERQTPTDERNSLADSYRTIDISQGADITFESEANYEQLVHFLLMTLEGGITGTLLEAATSWTHTFATVPGTASAQKAYTFEFGDNTQNWETPFTIVRDLDLSGAAGEAVRLRANLFSHFPVKSTKTPALSSPTVNEIVMSNAQLWIDGTWANLGTTARASLLRSFSLRLPSGLVPVRYADNSADFSDVIENRRHYELDVEYAVGANAITEYDAWAASGGTTRAIRLLFTGPTLGANNYKLTIDIIGKYVSQPRIYESRDGQNIVRFTLRSEPDSSGNELSMALVNNVEDASA